MRRNSKASSSDDKVNNSSIFFYSNMYSIKCTLDKIPERSKIIKNNSTLFSINLVSINFS